MVKSIHGFWLTHFAGSSKKKPSTVCYSNPPPLTADEPAEQAEKTVDVCSVKFAEDAEHAEERFSRDTGRTKSERAGSGAGRRFQQVLEFVHELFHVLEVEVDGGEADVGNLVEFAQPGHQNFADQIGDDLAVG